MPFSLLRERMRDHRMRFFQEPRIRLDSACPCGPGSSACHACLVWLSHLLCYSGDDAARKKFKAVDMGMLACLHVQPVHKLLFGIYHEVHGQQTCSNSSCQDVQNLQTARHAPMNHACMCPLCERAHRSEPYLQGDRTRPHAGSTPLMLPGPWQACGSSSWQGHLCGVCAPLSGCQLLAAGWSRLLRSLPHAYGKEWNWPCQAQNQESQEHHGLICR